MMVETMECERANREDKQSIPTSPSIKSRVSIALESIFFFLLELLSKLKNNCKCSESACFASRRVQWKR